MSSSNKNIEKKYHILYNKLVRWWALVCIKKGNLFTVGQFSALLAFSNQFGKPFNDISSVITELQNSFNSIENVYAFLDAPEDIKVDIGEKDAKIRLSEEPAPGSAGIYIRYKRQQLRQDKDRRYWGAGAGRRHILLRWQ